MIFFQNSNNLLHFHLIFSIKKMIALVGKTLTFFILKHASPPCGRSPVSFSLYLHSLSTSTESQLGISPAVFDILVHKHHFPPELASRVASHLKNPEKTDSTLSFFKESGFSNTQLTKIVRYRPRFLAASVEDSLKPKFKIFQDLGFSSDAICKLLSANPAILHLSVNNNIIPSLSVMKGLLGSNNVVAKVIRRSPRLLTVNLENTVVPNVEFLQSRGIPMERIRIILNANPSCFIMKPEIMRKSAEKAEEMGLNASSQNFIYAIPTIASMRNEAWEVKLQAFRDLGFSDSDVLTMFKKSPKMFRISMEKIKKVKELLLATGKFNISSIINCPRSLESSVKKRYTPRLQILGILESRKLINNWPSLAKICTLSDDMFLKKFIGPYLDEFSDVDIIKSFARSTKEMKPQASA